MKIVLYSLLTLVPYLPCASSLTSPITVGNDRPEGIHFLKDDEPAVFGLPTDAGQVYALTSEIYYGGINAINVVDGTVTEILPSPGFGVRSTVGILYDDGVLYAAGGGPLVSVEAAFRAFEASTGTLLAECLIPGNSSSFINDVAVMDGLAYITDSFRSELLVYDTADLKNGVCNPTTIVLESPFPPTTSAITANGE